MLIAQEAGGSGTSSLLFFFVLIVGLYMLLIRPQRNRVRQLQRVRTGLRVGNRVMTTAGLLATITAIDDDNTVLLEIAPGVQARFTAQAVVQVLDEPVEPSAADERGPQDPA